MELAKKHTDRLKDLKKIVEESHGYFKDNIDRYNDFMKFAFDTSLTQEAIGALNALGKPTIEFNVIESYISRLRGEFAKQMPSISVRSADGVPLTALTPQFIETIDVVESYLRAIFFEGSNDMMEYNIYTDLLGGGFSAMKVYTEYVNELSFEQRICVDRVFDPCLVGFDPLARASHKGDGRYCFELYPMTREQFEEEFDISKEVLDSMKFSRDIEGFSWSFKNDKADIILVCDMYEKKHRKEKIVKLTNGYTVPLKVYEKFLEKWEADNNIAQPPLPVGEPRMTTREYICRYRFCENKVLDYIDTDYKYLPIIFVDGNSVTLNTQGSSTQMTRPYVYHTKGAQMLKNMAGESLAQELESTIQHKFVVAKESVPSESQYQLAYQNVQRANTLIYNHFLDTNNPNVTLPPPREIVRTPIPPQFAETFAMSDQLIQNILGTYNQDIANNQNMSGIAIARGAIQGNSSSAPYLVGYIKGLNRVAQIIVDLIPKYYRTPRTLPTVTPSGKRDYVEINKKGSLYMNYDPNHLEIKVEAGVNYSMQKEISLQTVAKLMQVSPLFAQFMNANGLQMLLDNIDIRGIDELKEKAAEFEAQQQKQMQMGQQMQMQQMQQAQAQQQMQQQVVMAEAQKKLQSPTKEQVDMMSLQERSKYDAAILQLKEQEQQQKFLELMSKIQMEEAQTQVQQAKVQAENTRSAIDAAVSLSKHIGEQHAE